MAAKLEPELANILQSSQDLNKDTVTRLDELGEFLKAKITPMIPMSMIW